MSNRQTGRHGSCCRGAGREDKTCRGGGGSSGSDADQKAEVSETGRTQVEGSGLPIVIFFPFFPIVVKQADSVCCQPLFHREWCLCSGEAGENRDAFERAVQDEWTDAQELYNTALKNSMGVILE